jgi:SHS family lactate transporter-like MFS transporter
LNADGKQIADYGLTQAIFMGCVCGCLLIAAIVGKEERNKDFNENLAEDESGQPIGRSEIETEQIEQGSYKKETTETS